MHINDPLKYTTMDITQHKLPYEPPMIEVYTYPVEHGFAQSPKATPMGETFSEINDQSEPGNGGLGNAGENYHGEWY